jgi:hypothetical protein
MAFDSEFAGARTSTRADGRGFVASAPVRLARAFDAAARPAEFAGDAASSPALHRAATVAAARPRCQAAVVAAALPAIEFAGDGAAPPSRCAGGAAVRPVASVPSLPAALRPAAAKEEQCSSAAMRSHFSPSARSSSRCSSWRCKMFAQAADSLRPIAAAVFRETPQSGSPAAMRSSRSMTLRARSASTRRDFAPRCRATRRCSRSGAIAETFKISRGRAPSIASGASRGARGGLRVRRRSARRGGGAMLPAAGARFGLTSEGRRGVLTVPPVPASRER